MALATREFVPPSNSQSKSDGRFVAVAGSGDVDGVVFGASPELTGSIDDLDARGESPGPNVSSTGLSEGGVGGDGGGDGALGSGSGDGVEKREVGGGGGSSRTALFELALPTGGVVPAGGTGKGVGEVKEDAAS